MKSLDCPVATQKSYHFSQIFGFYIYIFFKKLAAKFLEYFHINKFLINVELDKQLSYSLIYSLRLVKLEILKTYIKIILANIIIWLFKSLVKAFILFMQKLDCNFCIYIGSQSLNNLIIKNWYILSLINKLLN